MNCQEVLVNHICTQFLQGDASGMPASDQPLLMSAGGVVDSVGLNGLITFIESEFKMEVDDLDIVPENFESVDALTAYVESKVAK